MLTQELRNKIKNIWDVFWASGVSNPLTVIEQLTYLMFIKSLDDNEIRKAEANYEAELAKINQKEKMLDFELDNLQTEHNALKAEMDSIKSLIKDNVEKSFNIFS